MTTESLRKIRIDEYKTLLQLEMPICMLGIAGLGKTSSPIQYALENKIGYSILPVAQLTEAGDLMGLPEAKKDGTTTYLPPDFLPREGKGVLIIDDVNRANDMILQSLLNFIQFKKFGDYTLPPDWQIVMTGNIDDGNYVVNELDHAFLSRGITYELEFERLLWGKWARANGIEERFVTFILKNQEYVTSRNNPRAFTQGFSKLKGVEDYGMIELVMGGCVPGVEGILRSWLEKEWSELKFASEDAFDLKKQQKLIKVFKSTGQDGKTLFAERLSTLPVKGISKEKRNNLRKFLHAIKKIDRERFIIAFIPINKDNPDITDDELFSELV